MNLLSQLRDLRTQVDQCITNVESIFGGQQSRSYTGGTRRRAVSRRKPQHNNVIPLGQNLQGATGTQGTRKRRHISAAARKRMSEGAKLRWQKQEKAG
jgi:hypothetical protein